MSHLQIPPNRLTRASVPKSVPIPSTSHHSLLFSLTHLHPLYYLIFEFIVMYPRRHPKASERYATQSLETLSLKPNKHIYSEVQNQNPGALNSIVNFKRGIKMVGDAQIIQSQEFPSVSEFDNVQEWVLNQKRRSQTYLNGEQERSRGGNKNGMARSQEGIEDCVYGIPEVVQEGMRSGMMRSRYDSESRLRQGMRLSNNNKHRFITDYDQQSIRNCAIDEISKRQMAGALKPREIGCGNCEHKRAKYHLLNNKNGQLFFCSKCAIKLLQKGYQIQQIQEYQNGKNSQIRTQVLMFMDKLQEIHLATTENIKEITAERDTSSIENQKQALESNYQGIFQALERMREREISELEKTESSIKSEKESVHVKLMTQLEEIESMQETMKGALESINSTDSFKVEKMIEIFSKDLMEFHEYKFTARPLQTQSLDLRLQKILNGVYEEVLVGQQSYLGSLSSQPFGLNCTDATIEEVKQPFRFLFPDDNDRQSTKQKLYLHDPLLRS